jgi:hypothetical protein
MDVLIRVLVQLMTFTRSCRPAPDVSCYLSYITTSNLLFILCPLSLAVVFVVAVVVVVVDDDDDNQIITNFLRIKEVCVIKVLLYNTQFTGC